MFANEVPTYRIDLGDDESRRWNQVIDAEKQVAGRIMHEAAAEFERVPELARWLFARLYRATGGMYGGEIAEWAEALDISVGTVTMLNCAYELSHLRWPKLLGCTAGVRWIEGLGMVHVRNLDWPLESMGEATRLFRMHRAAREFVSVGVPGQVGILSGMLPGAYSVTINWAPPAAFPSFEFGPAFLLRDTLETCDAYVDAVHRLRETPLSTSVFFTVCGTENGQACVIERTPNDAVLRPMSGAVLVQANHHVAGEFAANNDDLNELAEGEEEFTLEGSRLRAESLARGLSEIPAACALEDAAAALDAPAVLNKLSCQQMVFCPKVGAVRVWRRCLPSPPIAR